MSDLRQQLRACLEPPVCVVGVGNADLSDDGLGLRLAEALRGRTGAEIILAGTTPERWTGRLERSAARTVLFLDATDLGGTPGSVALLAGDDIAARHPQVSTHKLSLGLLARLVAAGRPRRVFLLGVQPATLRPGHELSPAVEETVTLLGRLLRELLPGKAAPEPLVASS